MTQKYVQKKIRMATVCCNLMTMRRNKFFGDSGYPDSRYFKCKQLEKVQPDKNQNEQKKKIINTHSIQNILFRRVSAFFVSM